MNVLKVIADKFAKIDLVPTGYNYPELFMSKERPEYIQKIKDDKKKHQDSKPWLKESIIIKLKFNFKKYIYSNELRRHSLAQTDRLATRDA